jgi:hypothetical protein
MGIIPAKIKYNLHQMNKEIIHQAAQAHAEKSFIQPLNAQGNVYTYWAYCSVRLQKALQIG